MVSIPRVDRPWFNATVNFMLLDFKYQVYLPLVGSLQYRTLTNCMYWFPLPFQLPIVI